MGYCSYEHRILLKGDKQLPTSWHEALYDFSVHGCGLTGQIPSELGLLSAIEYASFTSNSFSGRIPFLLWLTLGENSLEGEIPSELGPLSLLFEFDLRQNSLTGPIPSELGTCVELTELNVAQTGLSGEFPAEVGGLLNLEKVYLEGTDITGNLDSWACDTNRFDDVVANCQPGNGVTCTCCTECCDSTGSNCAPP